MESTSMQSTPPLDAESSPTEGHRDELVDSSSTQGVSNDASPSGDALVKTRPRGPNHGTQPPERPEDRKLITILSDSSFEEVEVVRSITSTITGHFPGLFSTWRKWPKYAKDMCWNKFKATYRFNTEVEMVKAKELWDNVAAERFKDMICKARKKAKLHCGGNIEDCKDFPPSWIRKDWWELLIKEWTTDKWKQISNSGSKNRQCGESAIRHVGGSIPFVLHKKRITIEKGRPATQLEVFERTHARENKETCVKEYVNGKAKRVAENYDLLMKEKFGDVTSSYPEFDADSWVTASGGPKKGRLYGFGSKQDPRTILGNVSCGSSSCTAVPPMDEAQAQAFMETPTFKRLMGQAMRTMLTDLGIVLPSHPPQPNDSVDHNMEDHDHNDNVDANMEDHDDNVDDGYAAL